MQKYQPQKTVLITGAAGFLGRYTARHFTEQGWSVIGIDRISPENAGSSYLSQYYCLHLPDPELDNLLNKHAPDLCVHCAGSASVALSMSDPATDFQAGPALTFYILNALRILAPNCRFLLLSSAAVYGNPETLPVKETSTIAPISSYGFHKWQCEQLCLEFWKIYGMRTASLRVFSAYGTGLQRQVIWDICRKALKQPQLILQGTGKESRDFIHARDIAIAAEAVANAAPMKGEAYNLGNGREVTIEQLAGIVIESLAMNTKPVFDQIVPPGTPLNWRADISALTALGFSPSVSLAQGVRSFAIWCREELRHE